MASLNSKNLKSQAATRLRDTEIDPKKIVLIHTGIVVLINLLSSGLSIYLDYQIDDTGGLGGLGTRSILQTIQSLLQYGTMIFNPFWSAGFVAATLGWAANRNVGPKDLLSGFRRISSILSHQLLLMLLYFLIGMGCATIASVIFTMTPLSTGLIEVLEPLLVDGAVDITTLESMPLGSLVQAYLPMLVIYLVLLVPALVFLSYNLRLAPFFIMSDDRISGMRAMFASSRAMRGHKLQMLKLDLSFWWYYVLEALLMVVLYLDVLLPLLGIELPFDPVVSYFAVLILYCVLELAFHLLKKADVETTYALAFQTIVTPEERELQA